MKIIDCNQATIHYITIQGKYGFDYYTRHNSDNWTIRMGESDENIHCGELETLFQEYIKSQLKTIS